MSEITPQPISAPSSPSPKAPARKVSSAPLAWFVAVLSLGAAAAAWTPLLLPQVGLTTPTLRQLVKAIPQHEVTKADVEKLIAEKMPAPVEVSPTQAFDDSALRERLAAVEAKLEAAQKQLTTAIDENRTQAEQVEAAKSQSVGAAIDAVRPVLLLRQIEERLASGGGYEGELKQLASKLEAAEFTALAHLQNGGDSLPDIAAKIAKDERTLMAGYRESVATGVWDKVRARLSSLVMVKQAGQGDDAQAAFENLLAALRKSNAATAKKNFAALPETLRNKLADAGAQIDKHEAAQSALAAARARLIAG